MRRNIAARIIFFNAPPRKYLRPRTWNLDASQRRFPTNLEGNNIKACECLYRAVDKEGQTIEFLLSAKRDVSAAKRFFRKMLRADHRRLPFSISVDKNEEGSGQKVSRK